MDNNDISGVWDWSKGPPPIMANSNPTAVPLVDTTKVDLSDYDLTGLSAEERTQLITDLRTGNTEEDLAALQPYKRQPTAPSVQEPQSSTSLGNNVPANAGGEEATVPTGVQSGEQASAVMQSTGNGMPNITGPWDWSKGPPTVMANPNPNAVPLVDTSKINLGDYDLSGLSAEERTQLITDLRTGNTEEDLAALQPYKRQTTAPYVQKPDASLALGNNTPTNAGGEEAAVPPEVQSGEQTSAVMLSTGNGMPNITGPWDWSKGPPTVMVNPDPNAVPLVDTSRINLGDYDLSGLSAEERTQLMDDLLHGNTEEDLAALQPYKRQSTVPYAQKPEVDIDLEKYNLDSMSEEEKAAVFTEIQNGNQDGAEALLAAYEKPNEFAQYISETPLSLKYSSYCGNQLSIKPTSIEYVINYFRNTLIADLDTQLKAVQDVDKELKEYAAEDPTVQYNVDINSVETACKTAAEECLNAEATVTTVTNAILAYGEGGWNLDACSILNAFLGWPTQKSDDKGGHTPDPNNNGGTDPIPDDDIVNIGDNDSALDNIFDFGDDALDNTGSDTVTSYNGGAGGIFDEVRSEIKNGDPSTAAKLASLVGIEDTNGDGIIDDEEISEAFSSFGASGFFIPSTTSGTVDGVKGASIAGTVGITAAAATAVGGKIYYDKKKEDDEEQEEDDSEEEMSATKQEKDSPSGLNMVEFKDELLHIGEDDE